MNPCQPESLFTLTYYPRADTSGLLLPMSLLANLLANKAEFYATPPAISLRLLSYARTLAANLLRPSRSFPR